MFHRAESSEKVWLENSDSAGLIRPTGSFQIRLV